MNDMLKVWLCYKIHLYYTTKQSKQILVDMMTKIAIKSDCNSFWRYILRIFKSSQIISNKKHGIDDLLLFLTSDYKPPN